MKGFKRVISVMLSLLLIMNYTVPQAANKEKKSSDLTSKVIEIPLTWTRNTMNEVNSVAWNKYNSSQIKKASYINEFFDANNKLVSPNNLTDIYTREKISTGKTLRTNYILSSANKNSYTIDYKTLEKWFESGNKDGKEPYPLKNNLEWGAVNNTAQGWNQSTPLNYTTQDWNLFRGIVDLNNIKDSNGNTIKINPDEYNFYLGSPNDHAMFIGANDLISVFVDEMATDINYTTTQQKGESAKRIKFIQGDGSEETVTYKQEYNEKYDSGISTSHDKCIAKELPKYNDIIDGWHVDLNDPVQDKNGNTVLGDVTNIIRSNRFGSQHMIDLLTSEWCNWGGVTKVCLYAVKKPTMNVEKVAYVKTKDLDGQKLSADSIAKEQENNDEIILNTKGNTPKVPANVPIYFKFILSNTSDTEIDNIDLNDISLKQDYNSSNIKNKVSSLNSLKIIDASGKAHGLDKLEPHSKIILQDEDNLKYIEKSNNFSNLNKVITNKVEATGSYFFNQLTIKDEDTVNIQEISPKLNITVNKEIARIIRDGKDVDVKSNPSLIKGDDVLFKISIKNNTLNGKNPINVDKLSLEDTLSGYIGENNSYNKSEWEFLINNNNKSEELGREFTIPGGKTLDVYTWWKVDSNDLTKGKNEVKVKREGNDIAESEVLFPMKSKKGTVNVTKVVSNYNSLDNEDKKLVDNQLFTIRLKGEDGSIQSIALKNGQTGQFQGLTYGIKYTVVESIPAKYKLNSISDNNVTDLDNDTKTLTFNMDEKADKSNVEILNEKYNKGWFDWITNKINNLKTAENI
ncbi:hypothetical protein BH721_08190 [Clostridium baratii]|uniref:hypothetical protein n=1 Tax=Clostridium baratii TaxID=1561 RepID=UPI0009A45DB3|nr:hypothetical protein [Clostridium baratii]OPF50552.1 hypothetical protein A1M12_06870 [Clostridium baratii]OPF54204.1 hypothetical protein BH721_08190 [Clostridium baratii]OPF58768.1 hypothetical protein BH724_01095 [Clostridium baratii]OPF58860.1 hypothetical protein BH725_09545 [Clostridium baratii]